MTNMTHASLVAESVDAAPQTPTVGRDLFRLILDYGASGCQFAANFYQDYDDAEAAEHWQARADFLSAIPCPEHTADDDAQFVTVRRTTLSYILDYLRENEEGHYDETVVDYPEDIPNHIFTYVLAIERELAHGATLARSLAVRMSALDEVGTKF